MNSCAALSGQWASAELSGLPDWAKSSRLLFPLLLLSVLLGIIICLTQIGPGEEDIWWHLKTGEWILKNRAIPRHDLFTYTTEPGTRWSDVQWLFQAVAQTIFLAASWNGLIAYRAFSMGALILVLWYWLRREGYPPLAIFVTVFVCMADVRFRFTIRPELPTFAILAMQMALYARAFRSGKIPFLPLLLLQLFWSNWHSSCLLGVLLSVVFSMTERVRSWFSKTPLVPEFRPMHLFGLPLAMAAISLLNPHGWFMPLYGLTEAQKSYVLEFQPADLRAWFQAAGVIVLSSLAGWFTVSRRARLFYSAVAVLFLFQTARMVRFEPLFAVATASLQAAGWVAIMRRIADMRIARRVLAATAVVALSFAALIPRFTTQLEPLFRLGVDESWFCTGAADFVLRENLQGRLYNEFNTGGYLLWRFAPDRKVFVFGDTRLNGPVLDRVMNMRWDTQWRKFFESYGFTYAIFENVQRTARGSGASLPAMMMASWPDWKQVFWDDTGMVFVKDVPQNAELIRRRTRRILPETIPYKHSMFSDIPALEKMARADLTSPSLQAELLQAISDSPHHFRAALALGIMCDARNEDPRKAFVAYRMAEQIDPDSPELLQLLSRWYLNNGDARKAVDYQQRAFRSGLKSPEMYYQLGLAQWRAGDQTAARKTLRKMTRKYPGNPITGELRSQMGK